MNNFQRPYKCKGREAAYSREWYKTNKDTVFGYYLKKKYGLTRSAYDALIAGGCGICQRKAEQIDHDHKTGKVRGALCQRCNLGLGFFQDGTILLEKALRYING